MILCWVFRIKFHYEEKASTRLAGAVEYGFLRSKRTLQKGDMVLPNSICKIGTYLLGGTCLFPEPFLWETYPGQLNLHKIRTSFLHALWEFMYPYTLALRMPLLA
jgi:hypothetical protein